MDGIDLKISEAKEKLPVCSGKLFGNPDVWSGFEWPHYTENREDYDLTFMCQINCAEIAPYDKIGLLPKTGILYFFYDMDEMPQEAFDERAVQVIHYDGDMTDLHEMLRTDHEGNDMSLREMKLRYSPAGIADGQPYVRMGASQLDEWLALLQIPSFETDKLSIKFNNMGVLCFFVDQSKLKCRDFADIHIRQIAQE